MQRVVWFLCYYKIMYWLNTYLLSAYYVPGSMLVLEIEQKGTITEIPALMSL